MLSIIFASGAIKPFNGVSTCRSCCCKPAHWVCNHSPAYGKFCNHSGNAGQIPDSICCCNNRANRVSCCANSIEANTSGTRINSINTPTIRLAAKPSRPPSRADNQENWSQVAETTMMAHNIATKNGAITRNEAPTIATTNTSAINGCTHSFRRKDMPGSFILLLFMV